jgi:hypothetical protein
LVALNFKYIDTDRTAIFINMESHDISAHWISDSTSCETDDAEAQEKDRSKSPLNGTSKAQSVDIGEAPSRGIIRQQRTRETSLSGLFPSNPSDTDFSGTLTSEASCQPSVYHCESQVISSRVVEEGIVKPKETSSGSNSTGTSPPSPKKGLWNSIRGSLRKKRSSLSGILPHLRRSSLSKAVSESVSPPAPATGSTALRIQDPRPEDMEASYFCDDLINIMRRFPRYHYLLSEDTIQEDDTEPKKLLTARAARRQS